MKRLAVLLAFLSFTFTVNATVTKEDIYNASPKQFEQLKKELSALNKKQSEQLKKAYLQKEFTKAFKAILSDKKILKNQSYAVIENGKIVKLSNIENEDGISFWHEHSNALETPLPDNFCLINDPSWENTNLDSPCGILKYQMTADSPYNQFTNWEAPRIYLLPQNSDDYIANIENNYSPDNNYSVGFFDSLGQFSLHYYVDIDDPAPQRLTQLLNNEVVEDIVASSGYTYFNNPAQIDCFVKPYGPQHAMWYGMQGLVYGYDETQLTSPTNETLYSLKTGRYIHVFVLPRQMGEHWWDGYQVILRWISIDVKNAYLDGDVGIEENNKKPLAQIKWDNRQITIELDDSVKLGQTTSYSIYDITGKVLQNGEISAHHTTLKMPAVASGVYTINVQGKDFSVSKKLRFVK